MIKLLPYLRIASKEKKDQTIEKQTFNYRQKMEICYNIRKLKYMLGRAHEKGSRR